MWIKNDADTHKEEGGKANLDSLAEDEHNLPYPPNAEVTQTNDQNTTYVGGLFENQDTECEALNTNSQLKIESTAEKGTDDSDSNSGKKNKPTIIVNDLVQQSAALSYISSSSETSCICSTTSSHHSTSSLTQCLPQVDVADSAFPRTENSSLCGIFLEELSSLEIDFEIPGLKETPPNVFLPKGKTYEKNSQVCETVGNIREVDTSIQTPTPSERHQWVVMNHKYVQKEGYRLGISPGTFYSSNEGYFVEVPNGVNYEIILTNENPVPCNVDVLIDNSSIPVICFRLNPGKPVKFDGPTFCENKFVFLRSKDAPPQSGIKPGDMSNGIIQAIFTPQKIENLRTRTISEPIHFAKSFSNALEMLGVEEKTRKVRSYTSSSPGAERGIDMTRFCQGATALRGEQTPKVFKKADSMEVDEARRVFIRLRLIARIDDPGVPSEEDICSLYPPSVEELLEG